MRRWIILWGAPASNDLRRLHRWIAERADPDTAADFVAGIIDSADQLASFPARGAPRPDLGIDVRTIVWRRRVTIAYRITGQHVQIIAIRYAGQDWVGVLEGR